MTAKLTLLAREIAAWESTYAHLTAAFDAAVQHWDHKELLPLLKIAAHASTRVAKLRDERDALAAAIRLQDDPAKPG
jgi:hypothetical protein